ncbi:MAG: class I SAM-dependent methyltransferase [Shinella sp.]|uniref:class I SAM-dependent methyltransferase n=1 Tax=Shinella sp. TaxID=1870904 RepID=UPI003C72981D
MQPANLFGRQESYSRVSKEIAPGDGMLKNDPEHYFTVGASASAAIHDAARTARMEPKNIRRVLDYACGYGRVLRWLKADFPNAYLLGVDADPKAAKAASEVLGVPTRPLDIQLTDRLDDPFDLIWVGSLFTHLPKAEMKRVLTYLGAHLTKGGLLVFTTHGDLVANRLASRSRDYGLVEETIDPVLQDYQTDGYGFASYPKLPGYGISVSKTSCVMALIEAAEMTPILYKDRGWAAHQDVFAARG